jgi:hypothetical protein
MKEFAPRPSAVMRARPNRCQMGGSNLGQFVAADCSCRQVGVFMLWMHYWCAITSR